MQGCRRQNPQQTPSSLSVPRLYCGFSLPEAKETQHFNHYLVLICFYLHKPNENRKTTDRIKLFSFSEYPKILQIFLTSNFMNVSLFIEGQTAYGFVIINMNQDIFIFWPWREHKNKPIVL